MRPRDRDPLRLSARKTRTLHAEHQVGVQLVGHGEGERRLDPRAIGLVVAQRDVRGDRPGDQSGLLPRPREPPGGGEAGEIDRP